MSLTTRTEIIRANNQLCEFSRNGKYLAVAFQTNLLVKETENFDTCHSFVFKETIEYLEWSNNSEFVLCANIKKALVQVYSIYQPEWKCKLAEGSAGLESVSWSPDSKHILTLSDFNIQISVWSLECLNVSYIQNIKSSSFDKLHFSPNGKELAVIITNEGEDVVEIYETQEWKISRKLICKCLYGIDGISWSPGSNLLCIWCSTSGQPKLLIYSCDSEKDVGVFSPKSSANYSSSVHDYERVLFGVENVTWVPSGQLLAVAGFNEMIVLLNNLTWKPILQLYLDPVIRESNYLNKVYKERVVQPKDGGKSTTLCEKHVLEEYHERPINIKIGKADEIDRFSVAKTDILEFSVSGEYLAIRHQLYPTTLWIWNVMDNCLDYLLLENSIAAVKWNPRRSHLLVFCKSAHIFEWTPSEATCMSTPSDITALDARWHIDGELFALCGYNKTIVCHLEQSFAKDSKLAPQSHDWDV